MESGSAALERALERPRPSFEWRTAVVLRVTAAFVAVVTVLVLAGSSAPPLPPAVLLVAVATYCLIAWVAARGIADRRPWALAAAAALLWTLIGFGFVDVAVGLQHSKITIPLGAVLAVWAFGAPRSLPPLPAHGGRRGPSLIAGFLVASGALSLGPWVTGPDGPFAAGEGDIVVSLSVECGPSAAGVPKTVPVTFRWSWNRDEPFPSGFDGVAIAWRGQDDLDEELFFITEDVPQPASAGVAPGAQPPSAERADALNAPYGHGVTFAVDLATQRFGPGKVELTLQRSSGVPVTHGYLDVRAGYVHLGRWVAKPLPSEACQW